LDQCQREGSSAEWRPNCGEANADPELRHPAQPEKLGFMRFAVGQARRAWLKSNDVLNTSALEQLKVGLRRV